MYAAGERTAFTGCSSSVDTISMSASLVGGVVLPPDEARLPIEKFEVPGFIVLDSGVRNSWDDFDASLAGVAGGFAALTLGLGVGPASFWKKDIKLFCFIDSFALGATGRICR